jgi:DNA-binding transcriptional regulator GbsR (MarR family)
MDYSPIGLVSGVYKIIAKVLNQQVEKGHREDYFEAPKRFCQR